MTEFHKKVVSIKINRFYLHRRHLLTNGFFENGDKNDRKNSGAPKTVTECCGQLNLSDKMRISITGEIFSYKILLTASTIGIST